MIPIGGPPDRLEPRFVVEDTGDELTVHVAYRAGRTDDELARAARKQAGRLAPVNVVCDDKSSSPDLSVREVWDVERCVQPGVSLVFAGQHIERVWEVLDARAATTTERKTWARKSEDHAKFEAANGGLVYVDLVDDNGQEADIVLPSGYTRTPGSVLIWVVPQGYHWARCTVCRAPWPCNGHHGEIRGRFAEMMERRSCYRCGKTDGNTFEFKRGDGFPERRVYHTRKGACLNEATRYANAHGWVVVEGNGWRTFRKAPDPDLSQ